MPCRPLTQGRRALTAGKNVGGSESRRTRPSALRTQHVAKMLSFPLLVALSISICDAVNQVTACTASFCFKLDAVSAPGIPEVERRRMEVRGRVRVRGG